MTDEHLAWKPILEEHLRLNKVQGLYAHITEWIVTGNGIVITVYSIDHDDLNNVIEDEDEEKLWSVTRQFLNWQRLAECAAARQMRLFKKQQARKSGKGQR